MATTNRKADLRSKRSQKRLSSALLVLLKEKEIEKISVKEIAALAEVSPLTFYNHFRNKLDLLDYCFYDHLQPILSSPPSLIKGASDAEEALERIVRAFVHFVFENLDVLRNLVQNDSSRTIYWAMTKVDNAIFQDLRAKNGHLFRYANLPDRVVDTFFAGGLTYLIYELIRTEAGYTEEEATAYFVRLVQAYPS